MDIQCRDIGVKCVSMWRLNGSKVLVIPPSGQRFRLKRVELVPFSYVVSSYGAEMVICEPLEILDQRLGMVRIADKKLRVSTMRCSVTIFQIAPPD